MVSVDVWLDKLPEDKAKYYNKTRMSLELFARKLNLPYISVLNDFKRHGYYYNPNTREVKLLAPRRHRL